MTAAEIIALRNSLKPKPKDDKKRIDLDQL